MAIIKLCHEIVAMGWHVPKWMINKSQAELNALHQGRLTCEVLLPYLT